MRHFEWDQDPTEFGPRIFVVTEGVNVRLSCSAAILKNCSQQNTDGCPLCRVPPPQFFVFILMAIEIFTIFFVDYEMAQFLLVLVLGCLELLAVLAGFTTVRWSACCAHRSSSHSCRPPFQLKNVATGLFLIFAEPFRVGNECKVHDLRGFIERVSLARTTLRRHDGALAFIPNGVFADWHQTNGNPQDAQLHELVLRLQPGTPSDKIQHLIDELSVILPQFAVPDEVAAAPRDFGGPSVSFRDSESVATPQSVRFPPLENRSFASTVDNARASEERSSFRVVLCALYRVKVSIIVDRERFESFEAAKTEVSTRARWASRCCLSTTLTELVCRRLRLVQINMSIVESLQRIGIVAHQQLIR